MRMISVQLLCAYGAIAILCGFCWAEVPRDSLNLKFSSPGFKFALAIEASKVIYEDDSFEDRFKINSCNRKFIVHLIEEFFKEKERMLSVAPIGLNTEIKLTEQGKDYNVLPNSKLAEFLKSMRVRMIALSHLSSRGCKE